MTRPPRWGLPGHWLALTGVAVVALLLGGAALALGNGGKAPLTLGLVAVAVLAGALVRPGSGFGTALLVTLAGQYYVATLVRADGSTSAYAALLWAAGLYLLHALLALAAALPRTAGVDPAVFARWALRTARTLALALPVAALAVSVGSPAGVAAGVRALGMVAALAAVALPVWLLRRRDRARGTIDP